MTPPFTEAGADAMRDALAMVRAALDDDDIALSVVAENVSWPALTLAAMAEWIGELLQMRGVGHDQLTEWQASKGLR